MKNYTKQQKEYLDKINELLSTREARQNNLNDLNRMLMQGFSLIKTMPIRWYVTNNGQKDFANVVNYLKKKYRNISTCPINYGIGELHDEFAFIPDDVNYGWEITQDEFNFLLKSVEKV